MCEPVSIAMAVVAVAGTAMAASDKAKGESKMENNRRKSQHEEVKAMYAADADLKLQQVDTSELARQQMTETNLQALQNRGTVRAAIGESMLAGNSMDRIERSVENEASAQKMNILDNYDRDYSAIFTNRVGNIENTKSALRGGGGQGMKTSALANALNAASSGLGAYTASGGKFGDGTKKAAPAAATKKIQN